MEDMNGKLYYIVWKILILCYSLAYTSTPVLTLA